MVIMNNVQPKATHFVKATWEVYSYIDWAPHMKKLCWGPTVFWTDNPLDTVHAPFALDLKA